MEGSDDMWTAPEEVITKDEAQADEELFF